MEIEIYKLILIALVTLGASYVQTVTGFGFGIFAMMFYTSFLLYTEANVLSSILSAVTSTVMIVGLYKKTSWKNLIFTLIGSFVASYLAINYMKDAQNDLLILLLGIALFVLSVYFFFFTSKIKIRPTWYAGLIAGMISGVMGGLFSIGGPPVVVYYLQSEKDTDSYMATISMYFLLSGITSIIMKAASGFVTVNVWIGILVGLAGLVFGSFLGNKTKNKIDANLLKKLVYGFMAVSGLIRIFDYFI